MLTVAYIVLTVAYTVLTVAYMLLTVNSNDDYHCCLHTCAYTPAPMKYRIAANFRGRKLSRIGKNEDFVKKTFVEQSNQSAWVRALT